MDHLVFVSECGTIKVELDEKGLWLASRPATGEMWGPPEQLREVRDGGASSADVLLGRLFKEANGRNRFVLGLDVELTRPVVASSARAAADLLATDVRRFLHDEGWGWGAARVESVYAPSMQFAFGDWTGDQQEEEVRT